MKTKTESYSAVVESGWCNRDNLWEERQNCGHTHRTVEAAEQCGAKQYGASTDHKGRWSACAAWHGYKVHVSGGEGKRVVVVDTPAGPGRCMECGAECPGKCGPDLCGKCNARVMAEEYGAEG